MRWRRRGRRGRHGELRSQGREEAMEGVIEEGGEEERSPLLANENKQKQSEIIFPSPRLLSLLDPTQLSCVCFTHALIPTHNTHTHTHTHTHNTHTHTPPHTHTHTCTHT